MKFTIIRSSRLLQLIICLLITVVMFSCTSGGGNGNYTQGQLPEKINHAAVHSTQDAYAKTNYNVYIENSASMDGYVGSKNITFQQAVYGLITAVNLANLVDTPRLN